MSDTTWNDAIERAVRDLLVALGVDPNAPPPVATTTPEPDPWPTDDLIVADWIATGTAKGHGLLYFDGHEYVTIESRRVLREGRDTLTNVVPVTVVPTAEWEALVNRLREVRPGRADGQRRVVVTRAAEQLGDATDALGLDQ